MRIRIGAGLSSQRTDWPALRAAALAAESAGLESLWTWDHLLSDEGPPTQPILEGWSILDAWAAVTTTATLGLLVSANTFRNPGLTAKLATTLDHLSGGRAVLGIGGGWLEREHEAFGIEFGSGFGERLDRLDEAVMLIRRLLDGEVVTHDGRFYVMRDAIVEPGPIQRRLPIVIGGRGRRKTLRTAARFADEWNIWNELGSIELAIELSGILDEHCGDVGRDPADISRSVSQEGIIRDDPAEARRVFEAAYRGNGLDPDAGVFALCGPPAMIADALRPLVDAGFGHLIWAFRTPYDRETIDRLSEVRELLTDETPSALEA
jgi:alkanesulfonate monooxygenase SsuD/methylene tetrahydromethanopterin reductase-like flavin-dependent oxidoreductase (luciferase family)